MNKILLGIIVIVIGVLCSVLGVYQHRKYKSDYSDDDWNSRQRLKLIIAGVAFILGGIAFFRFYADK